MRTHPDQTGRYLRIRRPWAAWVGTTSHPRRHLRILVEQAIRYGMPGRSAGKGMVLAALRPHVGKVIEMQVRAARPRPEPWIDAIRTTIADAVSGGSTSVPDGLAANLQDSDVLVLRRRSTDLIFMFGGDTPHPLLLGKTAPLPMTHLEAEEEALHAMKALRATPRSFGRAGGVFLQEAVAGHPLPLRPLRPGSHLAWEAAHAAIAEALVAVASSTAAPGAPREFTPEQLLPAVEEGGLDAQEQKRLRVAIDSVLAIQRSVLKHGDLSPQNCLVHDGNLKGIIDWETATFAGAPAFDLLNFAMSYFEHRHHLTALARGEIATGFGHQWKSSPFFEHIRGATARAIAAAGVTSAPEDISIAFFARRLTQRLRAERAYATGVPAARQMLRDVVRSAGNGDA